MSSITVLKSKLVMPELPESFILTERLSNLHKNINSKRAVAICAPAGYGKTTLVVSYFKHFSDKASDICWYRLDHEDRNPQVFLAHLSQTLFPGSSSRPPELSSQASEKQSGEPSIALLCRCLWDKHDRDKNIRTYIVLDDFHNVGESLEVLDMIRYMLDNLPLSCSILIMSRAMCYPFTEKQKLEMRILEFGPRELSFSDFEFEELLRGMDRPVTDRSLIDAIISSAEGWVAGAIILYHAAGSKPLDLTAIHRGNQDYTDTLFRYMSMEVFKAVDSETRYALAKLALLTDFTEAEASEILGINDIKSLIKRCQGFEMFIQKIPGISIVYRFHSLFREFLLTVQGDSFTGEQIASLHLKAAGYYMKRETYGRAAEHLAKCGVSATAMDMVTEAGFNKFMIGETGQLKLWLDLLPEEIIENNPVLLLFNVQLMPNNRQPEMVDTLKKIMQLSLHDNDLNTYYDASTVLIYILMCTNNMKELYEITQTLPEPGSIPDELKNTFKILSMVRSISSDALTDAAAESETVIYSLLPNDSKWLYLILSSIVYSCLGRLNRAEQSMKTALMLEKFKQIEPSRGFIYLFLSIALTLRNDTEKLPFYIEQISAIGEKYEYEYLTAQGNRLLAYQHYLKLDTDMAVDALDRAILQFQRIGNNAMSNACRLVQELWTVGPQCLSAVSPESVTDLEKAQSGDQNIPSELELLKACPGLMVYESSLSVLGAIAGLSGNFKLAERCLLASIKASKEKKGLQVLCGSYFHMARLYFTYGDATRGHQYLSQAIELAATNRYFMFWDLHIPSITEMALRGYRYGYNNSYTEELLCGLYSKNTVKYLCQRIKSLPENRISAFVDDFIMKYKHGSADNLYFIKATLFGKPEVWINGTKVPVSEWKTKKVKGFLEYMLLNNGRTISKELLAELFWPGSDSSSAIASQRTALYHLRKIISKYGAEVSGDNAFIYETPEGLQIRNNDALELDLNEFLFLYSELQKLSGSSSETEDKQKELLEHLTSIYKGELLDVSDIDDLYIMHERERLKAIFIDACRKLSSIYVKYSDFTKAEEILRRALLADPISENICLELLRLYMSQGRKSKALKLYYSFKKRFEDELDIKVDKSLTAAIK